MSTHVTIVKKPSGHNLQVTVQNPGGSPQVIVLTDNQATEVMVYGGSPDQNGGTIIMHEIDKPAT